MAKSKRERSFWVLVTGGSLLVGLPVLGALLGAGLSSWFISRGFHDVADADPSGKATLLAEHISNATNYAAGGIIGGMLSGLVFGLPTLGVGLYGFLTSKPRDEAPPGPEAGS